MPGKVLLSSIRREGFDGSKSPSYISETSEDVLCQADSFLSSHKLKLNYLMQSKPKIIFSISCLIINIGFLAWYIFYAYKTGDFHSDSASRIVYAREVLESKEYFPHDWYFENGDLPVFRPATLAIPLMAFVHGSYTVYAISYFIFTILILLGIWSIASLTDASASRKILLIAIFAAGISSLMAENLFGQISYGVILFYDCYIVFFAWNFLQPANARRRLYGFGLATLLLIVFWANPKRASVYYLLPLTVSTLFYFYHHKTLVRKLLPGFLLALAVGIICGSFFHSVTVDKVNMVMGVADAKLLPYELIPRNASEAFKGFLAAFNALPEPGGIDYSKSGIYVCARILAAVIFIGLVINSIRYSFSNKPGGSFFLTTFAVASFVPLLIIYVGTTVPDMNFPLQSFRYLLPPIFLFMIIAITQNYDVVKNPLFTLGQAFFALVLLSSAYTAYVNPSRSEYLDWTQPTDRTLPKLRLDNGVGLSNFLEKQGLKYGYASYWNAHVISALSGEKVIVRPIEYKSGLPTPLHWLSSSRWYQPGAWEGETFLLLRSEEAPSVSLDLMAYYHGNPIRKLSFDNFIIYVFQKNISVGMPEWDTRYETPINFPPSKFSSGQVGQLILDGKEPLVVTRKGESGSLNSGPFLNLPKGEYMATFEVYAPHNPNGSADISIAASLDGILLAQKTLNESNGSQELTFTIDQNRIIEFRAYSSGNEQVIFKGFTLRRIATLSFPPSKSSLGQAGLLIRDGKESFVVARKGKSGPLNSGPFLHLPKGKYMATFEVYAPHNPRGSADINIAAPFDGILFAQKALNESNGPQELIFAIGSSDFSVSEFTDKYTIEKLCNKLKEVNVAKECSAVPELNNLLTKADLYISIKKSNPIHTPTEHLYKLEEIYNGEKTESNLKKLNRIALEEFYPQETPKGPAVEQNRIIEFRTYSLGNEQVIFKGFNLHRIESADSVK